MTRDRSAYPPEFRRQMVDLIRSGRTPEELAREFELSAASIAGWAFSHDLRTRLVLDALDMAVAARKQKDVIHRSDKGSQVHLLGVRAPLPRRRCPTIDQDRRRRPRQHDVRNFLRHPRIRVDRPTPLREEGQSAHRRVRFIEGFYNPSRRHSSVGYLSPAEFKVAHQSDRVPMDTPKPKTCP